MKGTVLESHTNGMQITLLEDQPLYHNLIAQVTKLGDSKLYKRIGHRSRSWNSYAFFIVKTEKIVHLQSLLKSTLI